MFVSRFALSFSKAEVLTILTVFSKHCKDHSDNLKPKLLTMLSLF